MFSPQMRTVKSKNGSPIETPMQSCRRIDDLGKARTYRLLSSAFIKNSIIGSICLICPCTPEFQRDSVIGLMAVVSCSVEIMSAVHFGHGVMDLASCMNFVQ